MAKQLFENGNKKARGGKRPGAGRKLAAYTLARREMEKLGIADAQMAYGLFVEVMRDGLQPVELRMAAAKEVMDRILGKPRQALDLVAIDVSRLSVDQLERLAKGENVYSVLATPGESGVGAAAPVIIDGN